jgi:hypothetical protein
MSHAPNDFALIVGINHYPYWGSKGRPLEGAINDARAMAKWLKLESGGGLPPEHVRLIISKKKPLFPSKLQIDKALGWIKSRVDQGAGKRRFYFYFSGHGHTRVGGSGEMPSLCLPNWSQEQAGAALDLGSYVRSAIGCLKFEEGVFMLDCCRVQQSAPLGQGSDWECARPDRSGRHAVLAFAADIYKQGYEGEVGKEIRGYFTSTLLDILHEGTLSLHDLKLKLETRVPKASGEMQVPRFLDEVPTTHAHAMMFGPPPAPENQRPRPSPGAVHLFLTVELKTNLKLNVEGELTPAPPPGLISVLNQNRDRVAFGWGNIGAMLPEGNYIVRIEHGDAVEEHPIALEENKTKHTFDLPKRRSAVPLSSTADKHEWITDPAVRSSKWQPREGEQGLYVVVRHSDKPGEVALRGVLQVGAASSAPRETPHPESRELGTLFRVEPGTYIISYLESDHDEYLTINLPVPVAAGWDTQVFIVAREGRPILERATVVMRKAGLGFDPSDALLDAYERLVVDLATGGPGPEPNVLNDFLHGKYRNPLFGILGAHFVLRAIRQNPSNTSQLELLREVLTNLTILLGDDAPDLQALRLMLGDDLPHMQITSPPLFRVAMDEMFKATTKDRNLLANIPAVDIALGRRVDSPWNCWRVVHQSSRSGLYSGGSGARMPNGSWNTHYFIRGASPEQIELASELFVDKGFRVTVKKGDRGLLDAEAVRESADSRHGDYDALWAFQDLVRLPEWLINFVDEEMLRAERLQRSLNAAELSMRLALPLALVEGASRVAAWRRRSRPPTS